MRQRNAIAAAYVDRRSDLLNYARALTGDRESAADVVQDAWIRAQCAETAGPVREPAGFLFRIVRNLALDWRRRQRRERKQFVVEADPRQMLAAADERPSPEQAAAAADEMRRLREALAELDDRTRIALEMHRLQDAKLREIAARLGVSVTTAHELVAEGLRHCRKRLRRP